MTAAICESGNVGLSRQSPRRSRRREYHRIRRLGQAAARTAYYAAFHAAEALIMERTGKIAKTHSGVQTLLGQLRPAVDKRFLAFLGQAYVFKQISDYGLDQETIVTLDEARDAIAEAETMIEERNSDARGLTGGSSR